LITEAFIFFLSAFDPPTEMPEWSKVYPELRDDYEVIELDDYQKKGKNGFNHLLTTSEFSPELLDKVGQSLNNLSNAANGISDISSATLATDMYVRNLSSASESMMSFAEINNRANDTVNASVEKLVQSYAVASQQLSNTGKNSLEKINQSSEDFSSKLSEAGRKLVDSVNGASGKFTAELANVGEGTKVYSSNLEKLNQNISALNQTFEMQLKGTKMQFEASHKFSSDLTQMNEILASSVSELQRYRQNAEQLNKNLEALNTIYGNMLGALNYKK
jgi:archaellum component FlaC